jgi:hypothetical protein
MLCRGNFIRILLGAAHHTLLTLPRSLRSVPGGMCGRRQHMSHDKIARQRQAGCVNGLKQTARPPDGGRIEDLRVLRALLRAANKTP